MLYLDRIDKASTTNLLSLCPQMKRPGSSHFFEPTYDEIYSGEYTAFIDTDVSLTTNDGTMNFLYNNSVPIQHHFMIRSKPHIFMFLNLDMQNLLMVVLDLLRSEQVVVVVMFQVICHRRVLLLSLILLLQAYAVPMTDLGSILIKKEKRSHVSG